jgi:AraC-like DNA-binding protein
MPTDYGRPVCFLVGTEAVSTDWRSHIHKGIELGIVLDGEHQTRIGESLLKCRRGDTWLCGMWEAHSWRSAEPGTAIAVVTFLPEAIDDTVLRSQTWLDMLSVPPENRPTPKSRKDKERVLRFAHDLYEETLERRPLGQTAKLLGLYRLLLELERLWTRAAPGRREAKAEAGDHARLMPALGLVDSAGAHRATPGEAASACGLSKSRFHLLFRRAMGTSFAQYCMRAKVGAAAHRLMTSNESLATIAEELGFVDASHLHRNFLKHCGCTPHEYRKQHAVSPKSAQMLAAGSLMLGPDAWELEGR